MRKRAFILLTLLLMALVALPASAWADAVSCEETGTCDDSCSPPARDDCLDPQPEDCDISERSARGYCPGQPGHAEEIPTAEPEPPEQTPVETQQPRDELPETGTEHLLLLALGLVLIGSGTTIARRTR